MNSVIHKVANGSFSAPLPGLAPCKQRLSYFNGNAPLSGRLAASAINNDALLRVELAIGHRQQEKADARKEIKRWRNLVAKFVAQLPACDLGRL